MSGWEVIGVFVGIPVLVLVVIALPIFGPVWWRALRRRGDGHRYYGQYWDAQANCWRYASPNYVAQPVVATQIVSVPRGGVNTGDGSYR